MAQPTYTRAQFAQQIKNKYPEYAEIDDNELVDKMLAKYPQYSENLIQEDAVSGEELTEEPIVENTTEGEEVTEEQQIEEEQQPQQTVEEHNEAQRKAANMMGKRGLMGPGGVLAAHVDDLLGTNVAGGLTSLSANLGQSVTSIAANSVDAWEAFEYSAVQMAANIQGGVNTVFGTDLADGTDFDTPEERAALKQEIEEAYTADDYLHRVEEDFDPFKRQFEGGIVENLVNGNIGDAAAQTVDQVAAAVPSLVAAMYGGPVGLGLITASAFGGSFEENYKNDPQAATWKIFAASANTAAWELLSESITAGIGGRISAAAKKVGTKKGKELALEVGKNFLKEFGLEGSGEALSEFMSMVGDRAVLGVPIPKDAISRLMDTFLVGGLLGGGVAAGGTVNQNAAQYEAQRLKPSALTEQDAAAAEKGQDINNGKLAVEANPNLSKDQKDTQLSLFDEQLNQLKEEKLERDTENIKTMDKLTPVEKARMAEASNKIAKADAVLNDPNAKHKAKDAAYEVKRKANKDLEADYYKPAAEEQLDLKIKEKNGKHGIKLKLLRGKKEKLLADKKAHDSHPEPNPAFNEKFKVEMKQINEEIKDVNLTIENNNKLKSDLRPDSYLGQYNTLVEAKDAILEKQANLKEGEKLTKKEQRILKKAYKETAKAGKIDESFLQGDARALAEKLQNAESNELVQVIRGKQASQSTKTLAHNALKKTHQNQLNSYTSAIFNNFKNKSLTGKSPVQLKEIKEAVDTYFNERVETFDPNAGTEFGSWLGVANRKGGGLSLQANNIVQGIKSLRRDVHAPRDKRALTEDQQAEVEFLKEQHRSGALTEQDLAREGVFITDKGKYVYRTPKAFESKLSEEGVTEKASQILDENYAPDAANVLSQGAVRKLMKLTEANLDVLKQKIVDAFNSPGFPSAVDEVKFRKALHKAVGKPVQAKLDNALGKGKQLLTNIQNNTQQIYEALPGYAKRGDVFGGLFVNGNPSPQAWYDYFSGSRKRVSALKKALVNNAIDQYVDEALEEAETDGFGEFDFKVDTKAKVDQAYTQSVFDQMAGILTKVWPNVTMTTQNRAEQILKSKGYTDADIARIGGFKTKDANGNDTVWLNTKNVQPDSALHEFGHVWLQALQETNPALYNKGVELIKQTRYYEEIANNPDYAHLSDAKKVEEAMATGIGYRGTELFEEARQAKTWDMWVKNMWKSIGNMFGKKVNPDMSLTDFFEIATADILQGGKLVDPAAGANSIQESLELSIKGKTLEAFDFDDTLFKSNSKVIINKADGTQELLSTEKFPGHKLGKNESYDFAQFDQVIEPKALPMLNRLKEAVAGGKDVTILTARTMNASPAVKATLDAFGVDSKKVKFKGVGHSSAQAKANYIANAIDKYGYDNVFFADDAVKNVNAIAEVLQQKAVEGEVKLVDGLDLKLVRKPKGKLTRETNLTRAEQRYDELTAQQLEIEKTPGYQYIDKLHDKWQKLNSKLEEAANEIDKYDVDLKILKGIDKKASFGYNAEKFKPARVLDTHGIAIDSKSNMDLAKSWYKRDLDQILGQSYKKIAEGKPILVIVGKGAKYYGDATKFVEGTNLSSADWKAKAFTELAASYGLVAQRAPYNETILRISTKDFEGNDITNSKLNVTAKEQLFKELAEFDSDYADTEFLNEILQDGASELVDLDASVYTIADANAIRAVVGAPQVGAPSPSDIDLSIKKNADQRAKYIFDLLKSEDPILRLSRNEAVWKLKQEFGSAGKKIREEQIEHFEKLFNEAKERRTEEARLAEIKDRAVKAPNVTEEVFDQAVADHIELANNIEFSDATDAIKNLIYKGTKPVAEQTSRDERHAFYLNEFLISTLQGLPQAGRDAIIREFASKSRLDITTANKGMETFFGLDEARIYELAEIYSAPSLIDAWESTYLQDLNDPEAKKQFDSAVRKREKKNAEYAKKGKTEKIQDIENYKKNYLIAKGGRVRIDAVLQAFTTAVLGDAPANVEGGTDVNWDMVGTGPLQDGDAGLRAKRQAFKFMAKKVGQAINNGSMPLNIALELGGIFAEGTGSMIRDTARPRYESLGQVGKGKRTDRYEHVSPASKETWPIAVKLAALNPDKFDSYFNELMQNHFVVNLDLALDSALDADVKGLKHGSPIDLYDVITGKIPHPFDGKIPASFARYLNNKVFINPFSVVDLNTGETLAQQLGLNEADFKSVDWVTVPQAGPEMSDLMLKVVKDPSDANKQNMAKAAKKAENAKKRRAKKIASIRKMLKDAATGTEFLSPEAAAILEHTTNDLTENVHNMTDAQLTAGALAIKDFVNDIKAKKGLKESQRKNYNNYLASKIDNYITDKTGVEGTITTSKADALARDNKLQQMFKDLYRGTSNKDFYSMLYDMLPTDSHTDRLAAKEWQQKHIINPLENANNEYTQNKWNVQKDFVELLKDHNVAERLGDDSGIQTADGVELSIDEVLDIYNHIGNPSLYGQLLDPGSGLTEQTLNDIVEFVKNDTDLNAFAKAVPSVFAKTRETINARLKSQGLGGVPVHTIDQSKLNEGQRALLEKFYDGQIPAAAAYTPFTAEGDLDTDFTAKPYDTYTVMSGNLKARTGQGNYVVNGMSSGVARYVGEGGPVRTAAFLNFAKNLQGMMTKDNMNKMRVAYGDKWTKNMESMVRSIVTGQNSAPIKDPTTKAVYSWVRNAIGNVMFLNVRSAALQLISFANYAVNDPGMWISGVAEMASNSDIRNDVVDALKATNWIQNRQQGGTDPIFTELFNERETGKFAAKYAALTKFGYTLTKKGDMAAIMMGGVPYMVGMVKNGATVQEAVESFIAKAEETQQSARPERLSVQQKTVFGKLALAFMNTPLQYGRNTARKLRDATTKGVPMSERAGLFAQAGYYSAFSAGLFAALQSAVNPFGDDDDEVKMYWERLLGQMMTYAGIQGQILNTVWQQSLGILEGERLDAAKAITDIFPAISTKVRKFQKGFGNQTVYQGGDGLFEFDKEVYQAADAINAVTGFPADRFVYLADQVNDVFASDLEAHEKLMRLFGWSRYSIGESAGKAH